LPIPDCCSNIKYSQIRVDDGYPVDKIIKSLTDCKVCGKPKVPVLATTHLDPDIYKKSLPRKKDWRGLFGQSGNAQSELRNVTEDDLFLFFGVFQETDGDSVKNLQYKGTAKKHVIWGYLQVAQVIDLVKHPKKAPVWSRYHPHVASSKRGVEPNALYIANEELKIPGVEKKLPGYGIFPEYNLSLQLTVDGEKRHSYWSLPKWFKDYKLSGGQEKKEDHWNSLDNGNLLFISRPQGQEFVVDLRDDILVATDWLNQIFECAK